AEGRVHPLHRRPRIARGQAAAAGAGAWPQGDRAVDRRGSRRRFRNAGGRTARPALRPDLRPVDPAQLPSPRRGDPRDPERDRRSGVSHAGARPRRPGQLLVRRRRTTIGEFDARIVNVFAETPLGGNPLCVFEDARDLDDATMQALALQFNLSETTFLLPAANATAHVRIFTPTF